MHLSCAQQALPRALVLKAAVLMSCRQQLASVEARWATAAVDALGGGAGGGDLPGAPHPSGPATLVESFTLGWANLLVNALWVSFMSKGQAGQLRVSHRQCS